MSAKSVREGDAKSLLNRFVQHQFLKKLNKHIYDPRYTNELKSTFSIESIKISTNDQGKYCKEWEQLPETYPWLLTDNLVVKPDQLIKRRGKLGLIKVDTSWQGVGEWINANRGREVKIGRAVGRLHTFLVERYIPHTQEEELYLCIHATRDGSEIMFSHKGGVDVGDVDTHAQRIQVDVREDPTSPQISQLTSATAPECQQLLVNFIRVLYEAYKELHFSYLEINPLVIARSGLFILDVAAKIDSTAEFLCKQHWGDLEYPPPFGRDAYPEEAYIAELDAKSGASLKLTVLNPVGRIWTMVAGGGASVVYSDTICDLGCSAELANYGEYSGAPSESQTFEYAKTILSLMTRESHEKGKILIIGGGIANFTNVAATFRGIVKALTEYKHKLKEVNASVYVRRGGPNYQEGLRVMQQLGGTLEIPVYVFGPDTHMTAIVGYALGVTPMADPNSSWEMTRTNSFLALSRNSSGGNLKELVETGAGRGEEDEESRSKRVRVEFPSDESGENGFARCDSPAHQLFSKRTQAIVWGMQPRAVQGMLDYDHMCSRDTPSVASMVYPFTNNHKQKFYWGHKEILLPCYKELDTAMKKHPEADTLVNFASLRSAFDSTMEALEYPQISCIAIIAEGIPENKTKLLIKQAQEKGVVIIGPATVGGIKAGCFKIGNTGGMLDNILASKLYRAGSVAYVSRSGGMSNELNNMLARNTNGVYEGVAIGGDRYPGSSFLEHLLRYQDTPGVQLLVLLGEVGGEEEYRVCEAMRSRKINKPLVAWCIGTCADMFSSDVQFGHAGSSANSAEESAASKNMALREAGAKVPKSFDSLGALIKEVYDELVTAGRIVPQAEVEPPQVPMDYSWAQELGLIRKPASFMSSICDERGEELMYAGTPITDIFSQDIGLGGVLGLLWFQRRLPQYACKFIEMCLIVTADHGPAVSGAHNTIITARAGKDLVSSLASGLLTIGDRFGGALDGAAKQFSAAYDGGLSPMDFVNKTRKEHKLIMGIGHRVKSLNNPDMRVEIMKTFVFKNFPSTSLLTYALEVEKITTSKKPNLILNVDGCIAIAFVDLLRHCGAFTAEEATELIDAGVLNGLFVLGRSTGLIGHYLDQKRLKQGLYRHPWDDISYLTPEDASFYKESS